MKLCLIVKSNFIKRCMVEETCQSTIIRYEEDHPSRRSQVSNKQLDQEIQSDPTINPSPVVIQNNAYDITKTPTGIIKSFPQEEEEPAAIKILGDVKVNEILNGTTEIGVNNTTIFHEVLNPSNNFTYPSIELSPTAALTDKVLRGLVADMEIIEEKTNITIQKSASLAIEWKTILLNLDEFIKTLKEVKWRRTLTYGACIFSLGLMFWKMGSVRAIPDFLSNTVSPIKVAELLGSGIDPSKASFTTFETIMETPLTPLGVVAGVGSLTITAFLFKAIAFTLRHVR